MKRIILVGGGTAGHVEPALALGRYLTKKDSDIVLEFIGTKSGVEVELLADTGIIFHPILKVPFPRKMNFQTIVWPVKFKVAFWQSFKAIRKSDAVVGFGGYVSAPVYLAAKLQRIPLIIHEANAKPGMANNLGTHLTKNLFLAFPNAKHENKRWRGAQVIGMPIKENIVNFSKTNSTEVRQNYLLNLGLDPTKKTLLVFGGSIGATKINDAISGAIPQILNNGWNVIHSVGNQNLLPNSTSGYCAMPYIKEMDQAYAAADFIISRSGAVTCAELLAVGKPALLIPLAIGNGEQEANAKALVESGQAKLVSNNEFNTNWLHANLVELLNKKWVSHNFAPNNAAAQLGEAIFKILERKAL